MYHIFLGAICTFILLSRRMVCHMYLVRGPTVYGMTTRGIRRDCLPVGSDWQGVVSPTPVGVISCTRKVATCVD